jgi:hypothetical protein
MNMPLSSAIVELLRENRRTEKATLTDAFSQFFAKNTPKIANSIICMFTNALPVNSRSVEKRSNMFKLDAISRLNFFVPACPW